MAKQEGVTFRRIRGRIVPIKLNRNKAARREGVGLMVGGAGVAAGGAAVAGAAVVKADRVAKRVGNVLENVNRVMKLPLMQNVLTKSSQNRLLRVGVKANKRVDSLLKFSGRTLRGSAALGAGMIAAGVVQNLSQKDRPGLDAITFAGGGYAGYKISNAVFKSVLRRKLKLQIP